MGKSDRSKEELEKDLKSYAKEIAALNEFDNIPQNASMKIKTEMHSPKWNTIVREACTDMFHYAKTLSYNSELNNELDSTNKPNPDESFESKIVSRCSETIMKVSFRRFSDKELAKGDAFIEKEFINKLKNDIKDSIENAFHQNKENEHIQGLASISEARLKLAKDYFRFKESYIGFKGCVSPENEIQDVFIKTRCSSEPDPEKREKKAVKLLEKLQDAIIVYNSTRVSKESEKVVEDDEGNKTSFFDTCEDENGEKAEKEKRAHMRHLRLNEVRFELICSKLEEFFARKQKRKNADTEYWSRLITHYLLEKIDGLPAKPDNKKRFVYIITDLSRRNFTNKELLDYYLENRTVPARKNILNGKDEGQASTDKDKIEQIIKESEEIQKLF